VCSNSPNIELCVQLFETLNEFTVFSSTPFEFYRVATNQEYSEISLNVDDEGICGEFCATSGKIVTNKVVLVRHSDVCVKQLLTG